MSFLQIIMCHSDKLDLKRKVRFGSRIKKNEYCIIIAFCLSFLSNN